ALGFAFHTIDGEVYWDERACYRFSAAEIDRVLAARGVGDLQYYNGETHRAVFALPNYVRELVG
ncbi:MAG TPA: hypothetical protein VF348_10305, partial [Usitatibacter sp.]